MTGTNCDLFTHKSSRSYLNHLVILRRVRETAVTGETNKYNICIYIFVCVRVCVKVGEFARVRACVPVGVGTQARVFAFVSVALLIKQSSRMNHIGLPYFSKFCHKRRDFWKKKKVTKHKMCVLIFSTTFISNTSHSEKNLARYCHKCENVFM